MNPENISLHIWDDSDIFSFLNDASAYIYKKLWES